MILQTDLPTRRYLTPQEAADYLGLSLSNLAKRRMWGTGPRYLKLGRRVVYEIEDLDAWAREQARSSTCDA